MRRAFGPGNSVRICGPAGVVITVDMVASPVRLWRAAELAARDSGLLCSWVHRTLLLGYVCRELGIPCFRLGIPCFGLVIPSEARNLLSGSGVRNTRGRRVA